jgi:hypothetical protein
MSGGKFFSLEESRRMCQEGHWIGSVRDKEKYEREIGELEKIKRQSWLCECLSQLTDEKVVGLTAIQSEVFVLVRFE